MSDLIDQVAQQAENEDVRNWRRYGELLLLGDSAKAEDAAEMRNVMVAIRKEPRDLPNDRRIMQHVQSLLHNIRNGSPTRESRLQAFRAVDAHRGETKRILQARAEEDNKLQQEADELQRSYAASCEAVHELKKLRKDYPGLLLPVHEPTGQDLAFLDSHPQSLADI
jgi:hypothetical protein